MLSKEECLKKAKELSYGWHIGNNEFVPLKDVNKLIREIYSIKPYKFEDLKKGMLVWDNQLKWCFEIAICKVEIKGYENLKMFKVKNYDDSLTLMIFEKNRFYPVQMANVRCE